VGLYEINRRCTACSLSEGCKGPVPAVGSGRVMLVGEAPGRNEDVKGLPFQGDAGKYLNSLLDSAGISRSDVIISNVVKCRPSTSNRTPTTAEAEFCAARWLDVEIGLYQPEIIVAMGKVAISHFLGEVSVEHVHGIPRSWTARGYTLLPIYHPAAGLHETRLMRQIQDDFQILGRLVRGEPVGIPEDEYPEPVYEEATQGDWRRPTAWDTEIVDDELWSFQASDEPGTASFMSASQDFMPGDKAIVHNYLFDATWLPFPENTDDTMLMAYLLGLPQGLKELAWRLCGMEMESYQDTIKGYRKEKAIKYLEQAALGPNEDDEWPDPPELENVIWNKSNGRLESVIKKPQHISRKIKRILADVASGKETKDGPVDPWTRWDKLDKRERVVVEDVLGPMPDASLADAPPDKATYYACRDADATLRVWKVLSSMLKEKGLEGIYQIDRQVLPIAMEMQQNGIMLDVEYLNGLGRHYTELMEAKAEQIFSEVGKRFNPNSDNEVRRLMFEDLGFKPTAWTETRLPRVNREELSKINHPVVPMLTEYKHLAHLKDSFCDPLPSKVDARGRVHPTIKVTRTETGRWSMQEPNLQQIPARTEYGRAIRKAFQAEPPCILVAVDYSQIEMRVAAHLSQCRSMIELFNEGRDIHTETASQIFGVPLDSVTSQMRYPTKTMGFGVIYGLTPHGLYSQMVQEGLTDWTEDKCQKFIDEYYKLRPELGTWQKEVLEQAREQGYVRDIFGRIRWTPELLCPIKRYRGAGERQAINMPVQSSAQGIIKLAMGRLNHTLKTFPGLVRWLLQIHDELLWEIEDEELNNFLPLVSRDMQSVVKLSVPVLVEAKVGRHWGELKPFIGEYR
jgi:uracil-DNA glycosylase family 4